MSNVKNALSDYLRSLYDIPVLTKDEEYKLWQDMNSGNKRAKEKLIRHNLRFVILVVKAKPYWVNGSVPMDDLIQFGNMGLMEAVKKWIPQKSAKFASFARPFIERYVNRGIENTQNIIRLPVNISEEIRKMKYHEHKLCQNLGREPTYDEIAGSVGTTVKRITYIKALVEREPISLEAVVSQNVTEDENE
mgnify:CR=1 FL=1